MLRLDPSLNSEAVAGYVNDKTRSTTAMLNHDFPRNIISQDAAENLDLQVNELDEAESEVEVDFGQGGRSAVIGKVRFVWKKAAGEANLGVRPLRISCLVCEYTPRALIFGQPFLRRRRHYWKE